MLHVRTELLDVVQKNYPTGYVVWQRIGPNRKAISTDTEEGPSDSGPGKSEVKGGGQRSPG